MTPGQSSRSSRTTSEHQIVLLALSAGLFAWIMRAALDLYFFTEKTLPGVLLLDIPSRELYSRVGIAAAFLLSGIIISRAVHRLRLSEARARRLDQCVRSVRAINQLITRVGDRSILCQRACDELVIGLGYRSVRARLDGITMGLAELPPAGTGTAVTSAREPVTIAISCGGERLGELIVTPGRGLVWDADERALLDEVAEDIAFSVNAMITAEDLKQQREEVQTILDSVSAYISYKDRGGRFIRVNKALADVACIPQEDWGGKTFGEIVPTSEDVGAYVDTEVMTSGNARHSVLEALELPTQTRWIQTDRVPYRDGSGAVVGVIALSIDVTDRMEAERALACRDEQLRQSQKMEAIGQLAGGIAHDFNNLLTAISGYTELARAQLEPSDTVSEMLSAVSKAAGRATILTRQLLAFSRKQPLWLAEQDLNDVVSGVTDMLGRLIGEDIELTTVLDETAGKIDADAAQIEQVLMNLAVNARDAMPHGGRLTISVSGSSQTPVDGGESGLDAVEYVCLRVTDTGTGIDNKTMAQIFEPFFTTKKPGVGTGLGLSVVNGIVEQHGGWVSVDSEPNHGTSFSVFLPVAAARLSDDSSDHHTSDEEISETPAAKGERILLVEDEDSVRTFATRALTDWGYDIVEAATAEEALVELEGDHPEFDLIFSDVVLPGRSGTQLAREISTRNPDARILLSSGYLFPEGSDDDLSMSDFGFPLLRKPYSVRGLRAAIHEALS